MPSRNAPICISVINMKGGVGKTTIAALLSRHAAHSRGKVLAVDLDPQANLSQVLMGAYPYRSFLYDRSPSIVEVFNGYQPLGLSETMGNIGGARPHSGTSRRGRVRTSTSLPNNSGAVQNARYPWDSVYGGNLQIIPSRFDFSDNLIAATRPDPRCLARLITENFQDKDLVIIDCAPTESIFTQVAYHASDYVLVPVRPEFFATIGFPMLKESLKSFKNSNPWHHIDVIGVVINNSTYDSGNDGGPEKRRAMREIATEASYNKWRVFENQLGYSKGFPKMMRGDFSKLGKSEFIFRTFASEIFNTPELKRMHSRITRRRR